MSEATAVVPFSLAEIERMADMVSASKFFGVKNREEAAALLLLAQAQGMHPMTAVQHYDIVLGKPFMKAQAMAARFQAAGGRIQWVTSTPTEAKAVFVNPQGDALECHWTIDRAKAAALTAKDNWKHHPAQMLRARCVAEGVRATWPACILGMYAPEEAEEIAQAPATVIASEPGKGLAGLAAAVAQIPAQPKRDDADTAKVKKLGELRKLMRKDGIASVEQARQFVADNLGGVVVDKLDDLDEVGLDHLLAKFGEAAQGGAAQ